MTEPAAIQEMFSEAVEPERAARKEAELRGLLRDLGSAVIAYSGGVDSAYLAAIALEVLGPDRVLAVTGRSPAYPEVQYRAALELVNSMGLPHLEIETNELSDPDYAANRPDRCYFCKTELYGRLDTIARERGYSVVLDGSNADDRADHRPGQAAARERAVQSPLQEVGLTKLEIRKLSKDRDLPTWSQPAAPCLASRIRYGLRVTPERLQEVEAAEDGLRRLGLGGDLRVRHHGAWARLELPSEALESLDTDTRGRILDAVHRAGFEGVSVDLQGYRRGALNESFRSGGSEPQRSRDPTITDALSDLGLRGRVEVAGGRDELAVLHLAEERDRTLALGALREQVVAICRRAGFRYVTLGLGTGPGAAPG